MVLLAPYLISISFVAKELRNCYSRLLTLSVRVNIQANNYLATVTLKEGKVYAFFVKSPAKVRIQSNASIAVVFIFMSLIVLSHCPLQSYSGDESLLRSIVQSFRTV